MTRVRQPHRERQLHRGIDQGDVADDEIVASLGMSPLMIAAATTTSAGRSNRVRLLESTTAAIPISQIMNWHGVRESTRIGSDPRQSAPFSH
ncbi:MAG: hypothetical protein JJE35_14575 [Thermoleophilia bacterium]|nr:hypothetical protein [Thermoleophilia bacterium]